jgi:hypothetical protein
LTFSELAEVEPFNQTEDSIGFAIGCGLLNDDDSPAMVRQAGESAQAFGARVLTELDLPGDTKLDLSAAIMRATHVPKKESIEKLTKN